MQSGNKQQQQIIRIQLENVKKGEILLWLEYSMQMCVSFLYVVSRVTNLRSINISTHSMQCCVAFLFVSFKMCASDLMFSIASKSAKIETAMAAIRPSA